MDNRRRIQRGACRRFSARGSQPRHGSPRVASQEPQRTCLAAVARLAAGGLLVAGLLFTNAARVTGASSAASQETAAEPSAAVHRDVLDRYCATCHNAGIVRGEAGGASPLVAQLRAAGLMLDTIDLDAVGDRAEVWERVVRKLRAGMMPPAGRPRPGSGELDELAGWLEDRLDEATRRRPDPGRPAAVHRLNRAEYRNAVRDLLAVEVAVEDLLPADDSSHGFDNVGVALRLSESLLERYLAAARRLSRLAVGSPPPGVASDTYRIATDQPQHDRVAALPFGTRGGARITHLFPRDAVYEIAVELGRVRGGRTVHPLEVTVDGEQVALVTAGQPVSDDERGIYHEGGTLVVRAPVAAGPRDVGVAFHRRSQALVEQVREPFRNPRRGGVAGPIPIVSSVTIRGPFGDRGAGDTPSRRRIFVCAPETPADEPACAGEILSRLARRAYRRPATAADVALLRRFYDDARAGGDDFEGGIERALRYLLASPDFLFRFEADPVDAAAGSVHPVPDVELASRLSFFLWSSLPDDELLAAAEAGRLGDPAELGRQARRMIADPRSAALTENFAGQWLQLRNLADPSVRPGDPYSLAFDESLRQGLIRETELFFDSVLRGNRSVLDLLTADYTYLNERVAAHYGIRGVQGSRFRRVTLPADSPRRGILGHGSVLTLTSHAIRTSPVLRGKWILNNVLGTPPPDPPPNVPALVDRKTQARTATMRERMSAHRDNPACAACHAMIDPAGFALEHFDAIGRWRAVDESYNPIDASGVLPDGTPFEGAAGLRAALVRRPERFVTTVTEKLMTYALGRGVEHYDMPAVRRILRDAAADGYRLQDVVLGIVLGDPFRLRRAEP